MTEKCKPYQRRTYEGLAPLTQEVRRIVEPILGPRGMVNVDILDHWIDIVGPDLAQGIRPEHITFDKGTRNNGTLHVNSAGGAFAMLFEHQTKHVINRINTFFGYPAISQIKIKQGAFRLSLKQKQIPRSLTAEEKQLLRHKISSITDPDLRNQAYATGSAFLKKNKKESNKMDS